MVDRQALLAAYDAIAPRLAARGEALASDIRALLASDPTLKIHSVAWRLKDRESLARKLARPDRSYDDLWKLTDLVGVRVITYFADAVDRVGELVEAGLPVDFGDSTDKRAETAAFGYRSLHYVCRLGGGLPETARFELQVRTVLDHAWAQIEHDLGYKATEEMPLATRRRLGRVAGLLELADQEFVSIRKDLETYARGLPAQLDAAGASVALDGVSLATLLDRPETRSVDAAIAAELGQPLAGEPFYPDYLLKLLVATGVRTVEHARKGIVDDQRLILAMVKPYFSLTEEMWELSPRRMERIPRGYSLFFFAHLEAFRTATLRLEKIERLCRVYRALDYPDNHDASHLVARRLVETFEHIDLK